MGGYAAEKHEEKLAEERLQVINKLQELLCKHFGTTKAGWKAVFDEKGAFKIELPKFVAGCRKLAKKSGLEEYPTDPHHVFKLLHVEHPHELPGFLFYKDIWGDLTSSDFSEKRKAAPAKSPEAAEANSNAKDQVAVSK